jgi:hypothetical protein
MRCQKAMSDSVGAAVLAGAGAPSAARADVRISVIVNARFGEHERSGGDGCARSDCTVVVHDEFDFRGQASYPRPRACGASHARERARRWVTRAAEGGFTALH